MRSVHPVPPRQHSSSGVWCTLIRLSILCCSRSLCGLVVHCVLLPGLLLANVDNLLRIDLLVYFDAENVNQLSRVLLGSASVAVAQRSPSLLPNPFCGGFPFIFSSISPWAGTHSDVKYVPANHHEVHDIDANHSVCTCACICTYSLSS